MGTKEKTKLTVVSKVNSIEIQTVEKDKDYCVPIRPICDALGVDFSAQRQRIDRDEILCSTVVVITTVAADKKEREMYCLPIKYVWGWLLTIDVSRVKEEAKEVVIAYQMECYDVLYNYFFGQYQNMDKQIKEAAARKARIKQLRDDLEENPPQDKRIQELMELEKTQTKESRLPYSHIGKRLKDEYQLIINFQESENSAEQV